MCALRWTAGSSWERGRALTSTARWSLTEKALERLLERLGSDRDVAAREYHALRARLFDYFDWKGVLRPEVAAEETLDRVARRLDEGEPVERVGPYTFGVARLVLLEQLRTQARDQQAAAGAAREWAVGPDPNEEARIACLERCLRELPDEDRVMIVAYYAGPGTSHLDGRKGLAERLDIRYATLKTRAHRVRLRLGTCLRACLGAGAR
jgi:DNA-directed RNA polymerase specialized sigma24 family protein